ncbi:MAG: hypothetical protein JSV54_06400 [Chloroflexota bacterium]|nr:MAG: hypothetical protein JSV54_06400 [Chloroflexota bacterium]
MDLILTEEEKQAATWTELDDESVGKVAKGLMFKIKEYGDESKRLFTLSAAIALCSLVAETNADRFTTTIAGLTRKGQTLGDWKITIRRIT